MHYKQTWIIPSSFCTCHDRIGPNFATLLWDWFEVCLNACIRPIWPSKLSEPFLHMLELQFESLKSLKEPQCSYCRMMLQEFSQANCIITGAAQKWGTECCLLQRAMITASIGCLAWQPQVPLLIVNPIQRPRFTGVMTHFKVKQPVGNRSTMEMRALESALLYMNSRRDVDTKTIFAMSIRILSQIKCMNIRYICLPCNVNAAHMNSHLNGPSTRSSALMAAASVSAAISFLTAMVSAAIFCPGSW